MSPKQDRLLLNSTLRTEVLDSLKLSQMVLRENWPWPVTRLKSKFLRHLPMEGIVWFVVVESRRTHFTKLRLKLVGYNSDIEGAV